MSGMRLGKLFGIDILVDWSWFVIFGLITWSLAATFGQIHRTWTMEMRWGLALLASFLFFVSVLAHELAHGLAAQARGIPVKSITLFMFGGVANIQHEPSSPAEEMFITIVGPLMSLLLGAVFLMLGTNGVWTGADMFNASALLMQLQPLGTILAWLGSVNIMVGIFNLIPAFPLDGGRVVRSLLWAITRNVRQSTRWAALLGQGIAWSFVIMGSAMLFGVRFPWLGTGFFNGLWVIFIGWFLNNAASNGYRQMVIQNMLEDVPVRRMMQTQMPTVSSETPLHELVNRRLTTDGQAVLVTAGENVIGLVAMHDIERSASETWGLTSVGDVMTPVEKLEYVTPDQDAADAFDRLQRLDLRQIPVMLNNQIVGLLRQKDILHWLQFQSELRS